MFHGVDIVISALTFSEFEHQKKLVDAAKRAAVKRFIPSDWATACAPGIMKLHDIVSSFLC